MGWEPSEGNPQWVEVALDASNNGDNVTNKNLGRKVGNRHKVPVKQWNKWSNHAKRVFNDVYMALRVSQPRAASLGCARR